MEKLEFSNAYSEVLEILKYISKEDYKLIYLKLIQIKNTHLYIIQKKL